MSWGYWGIVAGVSVLLALFFVCLEIVRPTWRTTNGSAETRQQRASRSGGSKHAA